MNNQNISSPPQFYITNSNIKTPILGLGTADTTNISSVVYNSIKSGTRLIDTAANYKNETEVGIGINQALSEKIVTRSELFIITKLEIFDRNDPESAIKESLKKLNLDYVDLYLDHWPFAIQLNNKNEIIKKAPLHEVWPKMESLVEKGYTRSIGASNYNVQTLCNLLSFCKIKPSFLECEFHPYLYQKNLLDFCRRQNIIILAHNPLCRGVYCQMYHADEYKDLLSEKIVLDLAKKYGKTPGQIVLNWEIYLGVIPIPSTSKIDRMAENVGACEFLIEEKDALEISKLNRNCRFCGTTNWKERFCYIDLFA